MDHWQICDIAHCWKYGACNIGTISLGVDVSYAANNWSGTNPLDNPYSAHCFRIHQASKHFNSTLLQTWNGTHWVVVETYHFLPQRMWAQHPNHFSPRWRIVNNRYSRKGWRVKELQLYADFNCSIETPYATSRGGDAFAFASGNQPRYTAYSAFDGHDETGWRSGCTECPPGSAHLGIDYGNALVEVNCIKLQQWAEDDIGQETTDDGTQESIILQQYSGQSWIATQTFSGLPRVDITVIPLGPIKWRVLPQLNTPLTFGWAVKELLFFCDYTCTKACPQFIPMVSGYFAESTPLLAFDDNEDTEWRSECTNCNPGEAWIGAEFLGLATVQCVKILQGKGAVVVNARGYARQLDTNDDDNGTGMEIVLQRFGVAGAWESVLKFPSVPAWELTGKPQWERFPPLPIRLRLWRLANAEPIVNTWMVRELRMYHDTECRHEVQRDSYSIISSGARGFGRPAAHAFDEDHDTWWSSPCSPCNVGEAWLGVDVGNRPMKVKCVRLWQDYLRPNVTTSKLDLQFWNGSRWMKSTNWVLKWPDAKWKWRVVGEVEKGSTWNVIQINLFIDGCNSTTPALRSGHVIFSDKTYEEATNVRDNDPHSMWISNPCTSDSGWCMPWIGVEFSRSVEVECVLVHQDIFNNTHAKHLRVEYWSGARWVVKWRLMHAQEISRIPADIPPPPEDRSVDWALVVGIIALSFGTVALCYVAYICTRREGRDDSITMEFHGDMRKKVSRKLAIMDDDANRYAIDLRANISIEDRRPFWSPNRAIAWEPQPQPAEQTRHLYALEWHPPDENNDATPAKEIHLGIRRDPRLQRPLRYHQRVVKRVREAQDWVRWKLGWSRVVWMDFTREPEEEAGPEEDMPEKLGRIAKLRQRYRELPEENRMQYLAMQVLTRTRNGVKNGACSIGEECRHGFPATRKMVDRWEQFVHAQIADPSEKYEDNTALVQKLRWRLHRSSRTAYNYVVDQFEVWYHSKNSPAHSTAAAPSTRKTWPSFEMPSARCDDDNDAGEDRINIRAQSSTGSETGDTESQHMVVEDIDDDVTPLPLPPPPPANLFTARTQENATRDGERSGPTMEIVDNMRELQRHLASLTLNASHSASSLVDPAMKEGDMRVEDANSGAVDNDIFEEKGVVDSVGMSRVSRVSAALAERMASTGALDTEKEEREGDATRVSGTRQGTGPLDGKHRRARRDIDKGEGEPPHGSIHEFMESSGTSEMRGAEQRVSRGRSDDAAMEGHIRVAEDGISEEAITTSRKGEMRGEQQGVVKGMPNTRPAQGEMSPDVASQDLKMQAKDEAHDEISVRSFNSCETYNQEQRL
eukprot:GEMP01000143.1.p2 GENE.GEMP01000143.1~~GEMP01000143.1.p2  ORF type:complete len:1316 (+),score=349.39 GEMP01000143.1:4639-8586(+)